MKHKTNRSTYLGESGGFLRLRLLPPGIMTDDLNKSMSVKLVFRRTPIPSFRVTRERGRLQRARLNQRFQKTGCEVWNRILTALQHFCLWNTDQYILVMGWLSIVRNSYNKLFFLMQALRLLFINFCDEWMSVERHERDFW